jgi:rod shape-determining protein MreD
MDTLSGGPFGLYLTTYLWLFVGVRWMTSFFDVNDSVLLLFVVALGVLLQNLIFIAAIIMFSPLALSFSLTVNTVAVQLLWAIFTGPILLLFFNYSHAKWNEWVKQRLVKT